MHSDGYEEPTAVDAVFIRRTNDGIDIGVRVETTGFSFFWIPAAVVLETFGFSLAFSTCNFPFAGNFLDWKGAFKTHRS